MDVDDFEPPDAPRTTAGRSEGLGAGCVERLDRLATRSAREPGSLSVAGTSTRSPRAAVVFQASEQHLLKAQYTEGFRPPTFWEQYTRNVRDDTLAFEVMRTAEVGWVFRHPDVVGRLTLFHSQIDDMLYLVLPPPPDGPTQFKNNADARMNGVEAELDGEIGGRLRFLAQAAYVDTEDTRSTSSVSGDSAGAADWMASLALTYRVAAPVNVGLRLTHVGDRHVLTGLTDGYDTADVTVTVKDVLARGLRLTAGVRNVTNATVPYLIAYPHETLTVDYVPRTAFARLAYVF